MDHERLLERSDAKWMADEEIAINDLNEIGCVFKTTKKIGIPTEI